MSFQVTARTILQLGAELISSDEIAFYELIKNAIDAGSKSVEIDIIIRLPYEDSLAFREKLLEEKRKGRRANSNTLALIKGDIVERLYADATNVTELRQRLQKANSADDLIAALDEANYIDLKDTGEGMSLNDLREVYLTIGTRSRLKQRQNNGNGHSRPLLGEKGVGRLSTMRLGRRLLVRSSQHGEPRWNMLSIDWSRFTHDSDELLQNIRVVPLLGPSKQSKAESGTLIHISGLTSKWDTDKVKKMVEEDFSRFADPFKPENRYPIEIYFNNELFEIPDFDQSIFKHAHATVNASFTVVEDQTGVGTGLRLKGKVDYRLREIKRSFDIRGVEIRSTAKVGSLQTLRSLGPFSMIAYWYNRRLITATAGIPNFQYVKKTVNDWAGGLMLYRDGFRVHPYGGGDDDWLDLDQKALASSGYKVNRRQIIGKVDISSKNNPQLIDQTNREGLRASDEKGALVKLLKHILEGEMRVFLNNVEKKIHEDKQLDLDDLEKRVDDQVKLALRNVNELVKRIPHAAREAKAVSNIHQAFKKIQQSVSEAREIAESYKQGHDQTVHLAGVGLMVEMIAHELNRAAVHALATLATSKNEDLPVAVKSRFKALETQMKTLQKRLQILDPVSTTARQRKETFDLVLWIKEILAAHEEQFGRHSIKVNIKVLPDSSSTLRIKAVRGMIVQVLENLISNSVYWLKQQSDLDPAFSPKINIVIDTESRELSFTDNGPGIDPQRSEEIFLPFVTLKPSGEGKGLGLYIAREIATYHDAELYLSELPTVHARKLNTFVFSLGK
jgi:signal transduction histidine kinase